MSRMNYGPRFAHGTQTQGLDRSHIVGKHTKRVRTPTTTFGVSWWTGTKWESKRYHNEALAWEQASVMANHTKRAANLWRPDGTSVRVLPA